MDEKKNEIILFENQGVKLEVNLKDETVWLNTEQIAILFDRDYKTIRKHINNALKEELKDEVVVAKFENTTEHGAIDGKTQTHFSILPTQNVKYEKIYDGKTNKPLSVEEQIVLN